MTNQTEEILMKKEIRVAARIIRYLNYLNRPEAVRLINRAVNK